MKKLFFLLSIFAIVLSCSSDETSTPVTPPPAPIVKYTITLSAGEGGLYLLQEENMRQDRQFLLLLLLKESMCLQVGLMAIQMLQEQ
jgi:hypothetical protein